MTERTVWESVKVESGELINEVRRLIREGNVRRVRIKQGADVIAEFPLTIGLVGAVFAPMLAAIGALAALLNECTIEIERAVPAATPPAADAPGGGPGEAVPTGHS